MIVVVELWNVKKAKPGYANDPGFVFGVAELASGRNVFFKSGTILLEWLSKPASGVRSISVKQAYLAHRSLHAVI